MKRVTLLFSFVFISLIAFGQSVHYSPEELEKLQQQREMLLEKETRVASVDQMKLDGVFFSKEGVCPEGTFASNLPDGGTAYTSSTDADIINYQSFSGLAGEQIGGVSFWGLQGFFDGGWTECSADIMDIEVVFYEDDGGVPGEVVYSEIIAFEPVADPDVDFGTWTVKSFTAYLSGTVSMDSGWFSFAATNSPTCWILIINSESGLGNAGYYDNGVWMPRDYPTNYCLLAPLAEDDAPGAPQLFSVTAGDMGALEAWLSWENPELTFAGDPLVSLDEVQIFRGGELIHTVVDPEIGGGEVYLDTDIDEPGVYGYMVVGVNAAGAGPGASASVYVGEDVPAAPGNVILMADGNDGHVSWDAPTEGLNGGYLSGDNLVYTVIRMPDATVVAEDIEETEFLDTTVPGIGNYFYTVTASNHIGMGGTAASNVELLAAEGILMYEVFDYPAGQLPPGWVIDGVPHAWAVNNSSSAGGEAPELRLNWTPASTGLSRLITYPINVEGYEELRFKFRQFLSNFSADTGEIIGIDVTYDGAETWETLWEEAIGTSNIPAGQYEIYFDVPAGKTVLHLAFRFDGNSYNINQWYLDDMILEPVVDNDLVAVSISGNTTPSAGIETMYTVLVQNAGTQTQSDYTVKLMGEGGVELSSVPGVAIEFGETLSFELPWTPMEEGATYLYGYVDFAADEVPGNNQTSHLNVNVQPGDIMAVTIGDGELLTTSPYNFVWHYSLQQTLYYPEEIGLGGGVITGIQYTNSFNEAQPQRQITVWLGETDAADLGAGWVDPSTLELVFDGLVDFPEGVNEIFIPFDNPYVYGGGTLVIYNYKQDDVWSGSKNFYNTATPGVNRTRAAQQDNNPYDPANPPAGSTIARFPNITMYFSTAGMGSLAGIVTDNDGEPLAGVTISIDDTNSSTTSNEEGEFEFPYLIAGEYSYTASLTGYFDATGEFVIAEDEETVIEIEMMPLTHVTVSGFVSSDQDPEVGLEGALVHLTGYADFETTTDEDGLFFIEGVYANQSYVIHVEYLSHLPYMTELEIGEEDVELDIILEYTDIIEVVIGDGAVLDHQPFNFFYRYSVVQTLYYPDEIGLGGGVISGLQYANSFQSEFPDTEVMIFIGETDVSDLTGGWVDFESLQLVYDNTYDFPAGQNDLYFPFDDLYIYSGGNLVVYTIKGFPEWQSGNQFYNTTDAGSNRTRRAQRDTAPYDPMNPGVAGAVNSNFPNITLSISVAGLGALEGTVTENRSPVEGVHVQLLGTNFSAVTNEDGFYQFPYLLPDAYDVEFSKFGYYTEVVEEVVVEADETTVVDAVMETLPTVSVFGTVVGSDLPEVGIVSATVTFVGYDSYATVTDEDGMFLIEGVYADHSYMLTVQTPGYSTYTDAVAVGTTDLDLGTIIVMELAFPVANVVAVETEDGAHVSWDEPGGGVLVQLFQHDGDIPANPNAFYQTDNEVYGTIFDLSEYPDATVSYIDFHHLQWGLPPADYDYLVHIVDWANFEILTTVGPLTTGVTDDWELEVPLGYFSVAGYEQVGILIQPQGHIPSDAYPCITTDATGPNGLSIRAPISNLSDYIINGPTVGDFFINLWITTTYAKEGVVKAQGLVVDNVETIMTRNGEATSSAFATLTQTAEIAASMSDRILESYRVYRLMYGDEGDMDSWDELATELTETEYMDLDWEMLDAGLWKYAVIAEYTNENLSVPAFSNILPKDMTVPFTLNVTTNSGDAPTGAEVLLVNMEEPAYVYEAIVPPTGIVEFLDVWRGFYELTIVLDGFETYHAFEIDITEAAVYDAELIEMIVAPYALNVTTFGLPEGDALLTWNTAVEAEFRYDDGIVDGQLGFSGTWNSVMGAVHHRDADLYEMTWYLTSEGGPHNTVKVWVLGLTAEGTPDRNNVIYTAENVPNVDNQWNTYVFPEPLILPDGFFIGLSYNGFLGLAIDDGVGEPWDFVPGTQFGVFNITDPTSPFNDIAVWGFEVSYLLRGYGLDFGPIDMGRDVMAAKKQVITDGPAMIGSSVDRPFDSGKPEYTAVIDHEVTRAFEGFNVYLDGALVAEEIFETEYYFTGLEEGNYVAGVQSVYTSGSSEIVTVDFFIGTVYYDVTFNVDMTGVEGFDPAAHTVYLTGTFTDWAEPGTEGSIVMEPVEPPAAPILYEAFLDGEIPAGWIILDENGDGHEWFIVPDNHDPVEGDYAIASASWDPVAGPLTPDNWLITPLIANVQDDYVLSFYVKAQDPAWPQEKYDVLISTTGTDPDDFTSVWSETLSDGTWHERSLELSDFAGEDIYIAFRHWDTTDWFRIVLDVIKVEGTPAEREDALFYTATVSIAEGYHEYKYFSDAFGDGWDGGEWPGDPNRELVVTDDMEVFDVWGPDIPDPEPIVTLPYFEDFTGIATGELPEHWQRTHTNWGVWDSNNAGGESAPELRFNWSPSAEAAMRAITPLIDATDVSAVDLSFWHSVNDYSGNYTIKVQTSLDGETWTTQWEHFIAAAKEVPASRDVTSERDIPSTYMTIPLDGVAGEEFHIAFVFDGNSWNINQWYIDDILVEESVFTASLPHFEDFSDLENGELPEHWTHTHVNWGAWNSNNAGGAAAPELRFNWSPSGTAAFRAVTPLINGHGIDEILLTFMHSVNDYSGDYTLMVQTSHDGEVWDTHWEHHIDAKADVPADRDASFKGDIPPTEMSIDLSDLIGSNFHIAFVFDGNSFNINQWYIDDIFIGPTDEPIDMPGDANCDGVVNVLDIIHMANYYAGLDPQPFCFDNADVNGDGEIDVLDIIGTVNIFLKGSVSPFVGLHSMPANMYLGEYGITFMSDGTLAGLQFELYGDLENLGLKLELPNHQMVTAYEDGVLRVMVFSVDNTPIPAGEISLFSFDRAVSADWGDAFAGNLNATRVPVTTHTDDATGIDDISDIGFKAYPNPASELLWVEFNNSSKATVSLINVHGQVVSTQTVTELGQQQISFNLGTLPAGIYMLRLDYNDQFIIERIMVR
ncbi:MAG: carboxypeptidase regulatory-like domain-containing protein [Bacteroidales bacterium]|nr:carboxypeptidase regulatory-like domain-containing protein [Bacteroidales bacterium]